MNQWFLYRKGNSDKFWKKQQQVRQIHFNLKRKKAHEDQHWHVLQENKMWCSQSRRMYKKNYKLCKVTRVSSFSVVSQCYFCKWNKRRGKKCVIQKQCYVLSPWNHFHKKWKPQDSLPKSPLQFGNLSFINFILFSERPQKLCLELSNNF